MLQVYPESTQGQKSLPWIFYSDLTGFFKALNFLCNIHVKILIDLAEPLDGPLYSGLWFTSFHGSSLESYLGGILGGSGRVSFSSPDFIVRVYHLEKWYVAIEIFSGNSSQFENRRAPRRPFFSPISMHPRIARFLVNVSNAPKDGTILDPFCGTGGILMEAGSTGRHVVGIDMSLQMTAGAKLNLKYFGIRDFSIITGNFLEVEIPNDIDAIVTDLPLPLPPGKLRHPSLFSGE